MVKLYTIRKLLSFHWNMYCILNKNVGIELLNQMIKLFKILFNYFNKK